MFNCQYCNISFSRKYSLSRHIKNCKNKNGIVISGNNYNTQNNTINNTFNILVCNYGSKDRSLLTREFLIKLLNSPYLAPTKMIEMLHFNKNYPENMNIRLSNKDNDKKSVVLVEYPRKGVWAVGFATKENKTEMSDKTNKELVNVFVPTTPNPTSGFLLMFPADELIYLNMTFEEASKFIVSAGTSDKKS